MWTRWRTGPSNVWCGEGSTHSLFERDGVGSRTEYVRPACLDWEEPGGALATMQLWPRRMRDDWLDLRLTICYKDDEDPQAGIHNLQFRMKNGWGCPAPHSRSCPPPRRTPQTRLLAGNGAAGSSSGSQSMRGCACCRTPQKHGMRFCGGGANMGRSHSCQQGKWVRAWREGGRAGSVGNIQFQFSIVVWKKERVKSVCERKR